MAKEFAPGIKRQHFPGDLSKVKEKQLLDLVIQEHNANRRGLHYDIRLGNKNMGLFSWAANRNPQTLHEGEKIPLARTNLHTHKYKDFEGEIPKGYGAGTVKKLHEGKALVTSIGDKTLCFSTADKKHPERFTLLDLSPDYGDRLWHLLKQKLPDETGAAKEKYKPIPEQKVVDYLKNLPEGSVTQPKLDGALQFVKLLNKKVELMSHRISKTTGKPVLHTERFFGNRPHLDLPKELNDTTLLAEIHGSKNGKPIPVQETSGILNSSVGKALKDQAEQGVVLKAMVFGISRMGGKNVADEPYELKKRMIADVLKQLPKNKFYQPEEATTPEESLALWNRIKNQDHEHTVEGIVVHPKKGTPLKAKVFPEDDVVIRGFFDGEGKYKGSGVGGFTYSHSKDGPIVGRVGTGLSDSMRKLMHESPKDFIGRTARIHSHGKLPSGALRVPAFITLHEDK